jgi:3-hydroxyisobutyrate dehydrogenase-like beta-hydroxyacid dehydrogenase
LIGFGEAGSTFAASAGWRDAACAYDIAPDRVAAMEEVGVHMAADPRAALAGRGLVLSLVTAGEALAAAREYAGMLEQGAIWCDMNSVAPATKAEAAAIIEASGARYVDVAVLAPVIPARMAVPLLLSGPAAQEAAARLRAIGFSSVRVVGETVGRASTIKMIRSVMVKGIEALTDEMMAAADAAGVADEVAASLDASEQARPWAERAAYNIERMRTHGERRAAEMEEAAATLRSLGVDPVMTESTVRRQRDAAARQRDRIMRKQVMQHG